MKLSTHSNIGRWCRRYGLFLGELAGIKREFEQFRRKPQLPVAAEHPPFAGQAMWAKGIALRIQRQWEVGCCLQLRSAEESSFSCWTRSCWS